MSLDFSAQTIDEQSQMLARHLPDGDAWVNKFNSESNLGKLIIGLAAEYLKISIMIEDSLNEVNINTTVQLIDEWERSVGIPDDCFDASGTLQERRDRVISKLSNYGGIQTAEDFERLALTLGFNVEVTNGTANGVFPLKFPIRFFDNRKEAVHTIIVNLEEQRSVFPLTFPIEFSSGVTGIIECLFKKLAPANCQVLFLYGVN